MDSLNGTSMTNDTTEISYDNALEHPLLNFTPEGFVHGLHAFIALVMHFGLPGNILVVLVHRRITTPTATDWVVFYLAVCDICSLVVCGPSFVLIIRKVWNSFMPSFFCSFHYMIVHTCFIASTTLITLAAVIRRSVMITNRERMLSEHHTKDPQCCSCCANWFGQHKQCIRSNAAGCNQSYNAGFPGVFVLYSRFSHTKRLKPQRRRRYEHTHICLLSPVFH
ncbi:hypothetical protein DPMN_034030 [Dreissena polymorpha]|uniref:G-protein coupled receptors family 1 profile domain-containing protein n=1 Tax=Dreissena polymorpha TaxID=45954 RepID=A0A9D4RJP5_DREPO|nr:hypothetical protein DPMN_034030 [Dreissena polymorpha]